MFIYDNGEICVCAFARCGHTSMYHHFGFEPYHSPNTFKDWIETKSRRILVLRNPWDRIQSAMVMFDQVFSLEGDDLIQFRLHIEPTLSLIKKTIPFEIIDFYRLNEYIKLSKSSPITNSNYVSRQLLFEKIQTEIPNTLYLKRFRKEYNQYRYFKNSAKEITPEEWKSLTKIS